ncbi:MAG: exodeoxyribonuclease VII large subunit [Ruminococcaceae bacterium]|nr:exodeoxyribonuclease VII large subunit [Oscillospiraceae bacterium]
MERNKITLSVSELNDYVKMLLDGDRVLSNVYVCGEISNFKLYASGHAYLTLKDRDGQLKAVMFRSYASRLAFRPEDGMRVIAHGRVSVYEATGQYQLYIDSMQPDGVGALALQYEQLKRKLEAEGLFDEARKKPLPSMPMRIGVITSPSGAAVHDIQNILNRRFPCAEMILFPSAVQGAEAAPNLCMGLEFFGMTGLCDVIIIGRGGGSAEDLWAFNDETLARTIAACPIPVISAVGHESDFTICDFVADRRAPTPSAAAELAVPDRTELMGQLLGLGQRFSQLVGARIAQEKRVLRQMVSSPAIRSPERILDGFRMRLGERERSLEQSVQSSLEAKRNRMLRMSAKLEGLSPLSVLSRGYAAVSKGEETVTSAEALQRGDQITIRFFDGQVEACVEREKG